MGWCEGGEHTRVEGGGVEGGGMLTGGGARVWGGRGGWGLR